MPRRPAAIMIQGTNSDAGKSLIVAGLCRLFTNRGLIVRPFKPQNMSNNAAATPDGGEIGRAQALQARACRAELSVHMNPVLLKPQSETGAQVVLQGRAQGAREARDYFSHRERFLPAVLESFSMIGHGADLVIVEGAGSPSEVNLRANDIANMGFARAADVPVILLGDIERGGVIAGVIGTKAVLAAEDAAMIKGFLINKFRGDVSLFDGGLAHIAATTGWPSLGVIPWFDRAHLLPAEDAVQLGRPEARAKDAIKIAVPMLPGIANFDDLDPLSAEADVIVDFIPPAQPLPQDADVILLPGSKTTIRDLAFLREQGWDIDLKAHLRQGKRVIGLCGGFQMLGHWIDDPEGLEGPVGRAPGLGLLAMATMLAPRKIVGPMQGHMIGSDIPVAGYEIHAGRTEGAALTRPWLRFEDGRMDGAVSENGLVAGTYLHGLFGSDAFRRHFLNELRGGRSSVLAYETQVEQVLDDLAAHLARHFDPQTVLRLASS